MARKFNIEKIFFEFLGVFLIALGIIFFLSSYFLALEIGNPIAGYLVGLFSIGLYRLGVYTIKSVR